MFKGQVGSLLQVVALINLLLCYQSRPNIQINVSITVLSGFVCFFKIVEVHQIIIFVLAFQKQNRCALTHLNIKLLPK